MKEPKTAKEILYAKCQEKGGCFLAGQVGWVIEAMEEYMAQEVWQTRNEMREEYGNLKGQHQEQMRDMRDEYKGYGGGCW